MRTSSSSKHFLFCVISYTEASSKGKDVDSRPDVNKEDGNVSQNGNATTSVTSAASRKRSPNTRTSPTMNSGSSKSKRLLGSAVVSDGNKKDEGGGANEDGGEQRGDRDNMETESCATEGVGGITSQVSSASSSNSSSGYSSSRSNNKANNGTRGTSKSAENGKENRVPSTSLMASSPRGDVSPVPIIKNRPQRSFIGYVSPYEQFLRFTETDPKYRSEKSQGKILGLYKFCGEIGSGNFSKVKLGIHQLTKGWYINL